MAVDASQGAAGGDICGPAAALTRCYWQARYDQGQTGWDRGGVSPTLVQWLAAGDMRPCRILVPGCGRGHEVVALAKAGFDVTGVDFAPAAVVAVQRQLASLGLVADVVQSDLFAYRPDRPFAAIYEQTCLCALPPERWAEYEERLAAWLTLGGRLFAAFMQTDSADGPPFACHPEAMRELFAADRWDWPERLEPQEHPAGLRELTGVLRRR
jgi:SAM-dependent methyltransferase